MEIVSFAGIEVKIKKGGFIGGWRLAGEKKWRAPPIPDDVLFYLETESFFNQTVPDMINIGKIFGL